ncbi:S-adenosyl-L-methionine-dependent methyltransferase [Rhodocollybia butyracea]|uniref:S-adenosyl-L-methionine-dependent methyltransferase n=1 Tax=Rhodocollybia butyracea TaxID=206335 RepID=A0A9P5PLI0_9AGAR|nr:S-adenosyl-L-methionine-dependent methyltransferase [Rhodocollybia butyracea]
MSITPLTELGNIVTSSIQTLEAAYAKSGIPYPSLDEPFKPGPLDDDFALGQTTRVLIAAAYQIIATVRGPMETIQDYAPAMYLSSSLGVAVESNIPDIVKDSGLQGLDTRDIAAKAGIDESKTARILRYLASRHVFREVTPNVFANNRISSVLVKAHSLEEIKKNPKIKYEGSPAAAFVGHLTDESLKSAAYISKFIEENPTDIAAPFNMALDPTADMWTWYEKPGNDLRLIRFSSAMKGSGDRFPPDSFTKDIYWKDLKPDSVVVDVGGSVGSVTHLLVKAFPDLKYVVQDLPKVIGQAHEYWKAQYPDEASNPVKTSRVTLQPHNFFFPQPIPNASVYMMRFVLHDWPASKCHTILNHLRAAASKTTKLILFEAIMPYACPPPDGPFSREMEASAGGAGKAPWPLLSNLGLGVGGFHTMFDMQMMTMFNGQERTLPEFSELGRKTGWQLQSVHVDGPLSGIVFVPV